MGYVPYVVVWREPGYDREVGSRPYRTRQRAQRRLDQERRRLPEQRKRLRVEHVGWAAVIEDVLMGALLLSVILVAIVAVYLLLHALLSN